MKGQVLFYGKKGSQRRRDLCGPVPAHRGALALFTGFRLSELLGLTWDAVDFGRGTVAVDKQLSADFTRGPLFSTPKSGKPRIVMPAASAFQVLRKQKMKQAEQRLKAGPLWVNPCGLIFTDEDGGPMSQQTAEKEFSFIRAAVGLDAFRFHDLRHPNVEFKTKNLYLLSIKLEINDFAVKRREIIERESG